VDDTNPVPSPDGSRVAFAREVDDDELAIIVRSMDGTERVLQGTTLSAEYAWSPDSALLARLALAGRDGRLVLRHRRRSDPMPSPSGDQARRSALCCAGMRELSNGGRWSSRGVSTSIPR
jgi:hypothetical protein